MKVSIIGAIITAIMNSTTGADSLIASGPPISSTPKISDNSVIGNTAI